MKNSFIGSLALNVIFWFIFLETLFFHIHNNSFGSALILSILILLNVLFNIRWDWK